MVRLPSHVKQEQLLVDAEKLTVALEASKAEVKKYGHFEAFFSVHWDWATPADALQVVFERWRRAPETQKEARYAFFKGQIWTGSYLCTQGPTQLNLEVTKVLHDSDGQAEIEADLSFQLKTKKGKKGEKEAVQGAYSVAGRIEAQGRALVLEPVSGSWKTKPSDFVMVGLQGVVSRSGQKDYLRYAGSIPIFGCDSFELTSKRLTEVPAPAPPPAAVEEPAAQHQRALWNSALSRLAESLTAAQKRWRVELQALIADGMGKAKSKKISDTAQVQQLFKAARTAGLVSFELTTSDGEQFVVKIGQPGEQPGE